MAFNSRQVDLTFKALDDIWDEPDAGHTTANTPGNTLRLLDNLLPASGTLSTFANNTQSEESIWGFASSGTAEVYGAYTQLIASTGFAATQIQINIHINHTTTGAGARFTIATGVATSEVPEIIGIGVNIRVAASGTQSSGSKTVNFAFPSGVRLAFRSKDANAGALSYGMQITLLGP